ASADLPHGPSGGSMASMYQTCTLLCPTLTSTGGLLMSMAAIGLLERFKISVSRFPHGFNPIENSNPSTGVSNHGNRWKKTSALSTCAGTVTAGSLANA